MPPLRTCIDPRLTELAVRIAQAGGRAIVVGGFVRDYLLGHPGKDVDIEVFGLEPSRLEAILSTAGAVHAVGKQFGVFKVKGLEADFSLPRRDSKVAPGHRGFAVEVDTSLTFDDAARRRDFTVNSIGIDPLTEAVLDPFGGVDDLEARMLRITDAAHFAEDPLRGLRAAQFIARFELSTDAELIRECAKLDLGELAPERVLGELEKLLIKGRKPSLGLEFLARTDLVRYFPELEALIGVPQDPAWHPEGDVWVHTLMVVDQAALIHDRELAREQTLRATGAVNRAAALMFAALCHDLGKPSVTAEIDGRIRSRAHDRVGADLTAAFLGRLRASHRLTRCVAALVEAHLAPALLVEHGATAKAYRRLARKLEAAGASVELLERVARADHLGRTTPDARAGRVAWQAAFLGAARDALTELRAPMRAVTGRDLLDRGYAPGPGLGAILKRCQEIQDETGWTDKARIIERALGS